MRNETRRRASKNTISFDQIEVACSQVDELLSRGVTENVATRTLRTMVDLYARQRHDYSSGPMHPLDVGLWSTAARRHWTTYGDKSALRIEHGTPVHSIVKDVLDMHRTGDLTEKLLRRYVARTYVLAVITKAQDAALNKAGLRSTPLRTPFARWEKAGICFARSALPRNHAARRQSRVAA